MVKYTEVKKNEGPEHACPHTVLSNHAHTIAVNATSSGNMYGPTNPNGSRRRLASL
jgi:hypothetical protein